MKQIDKYILFQGVLDWCNEIRQIKGREPLNELPKGVQKDGYSCPCGRATGAFVGSVRWAETKEKLYTSLGEESLPAIVQEFIPRFDSGEFPELVDGPVLL